MKIGALRETYPGESRVALTPDSALQLQRLGHTCMIESHAGLAAGFTDVAYEAAGVRVVPSAGEVFSEVDIVVKVRPPTPGEAGQLSHGQTLIAFFWPAQNTDLLELAKRQGATVIAMDMVPRISRAQKMDALSSMANIAGYRAVIEAGNHFGRFFTGQVTAAGKVPPAKVLVVGAGVAGLAAIGTATSLGAMTYAFDVRPEVAEQIESMGAQFVFLDFEEAQDGAATGGYAAPSSPEFHEKQLAKFRELAPEIDIVITTALIPGRPAPKLWTADMVQAMKPGSVIVDLAAERGGNCDLTVPDQTIVTDNGVTVVGITDFPSRMAAQASTLYANNIRHMLADLTPGKDGVIHHNMEDDVIRGSTVTHQGAITYPPPPPKVPAIAAAKPKDKPKAADAGGEAGRGGGRLQGADPQPGRPARRGRPADRAGRRLCARKLHGPLHRVCAGLLRRLPSDLERQPFPAHAADGGDQRHLGHRGAGRPAAGRLRPLAGGGAGRALLPDRHHQHRRRLPGHAPDAGHVPEVVRIVR